MNIETKTYSDGTVATGSAPLPAQSPAQQEPVTQLLGAIEDYGQWLWDAGYSDSPSSEMLADDSADRLKEMRERIEHIQQDAYAEGRKDEREALLPDVAPATLVKRFEVAMERFNSAYADPYADAEDRGDARRTLNDARNALLAAVAKSA